MKIQSTDLITVAGQTRSGKSTLAKYLARQIQAAGIDVVVFDPMAEYIEFTSYIPKSDSPAELDLFCAQAWARGNTFIIVDESELYLAEKKALPRHVFRCVLRGGHRGIGMMFITKRIALLSKNCFALSHHIFLFRIFAPNDINYIAQFCPRTVTEKLRRLPPWHYLYYHEGEVIEFEPLKL